MKRVSRILLAVLLFAGGLPAAALAAPLASAALPVCASNEFETVDRYFFSPDFARDQTVFAKAVRPGDKGWQSYRSVDGGRTWLLNQQENISDLAFSPKYEVDGTVYASIYASAIDAQYFLRSRDRGDTWERVIIPRDGPWVTSFGSIAVEDADTIWYASSGAPIWPDPLSYGLYRFSFAGNAVAWERLSELHINEIALSPDFAHDRTLLVGAYGYKINYGPYKSTDGGRSWTSIANGIDLSFTGISGSTASLLFAPDYPRDPLLFAEAISKFYRSRDGGASWQRVDPLEPNPPTSYDSARWVLSPRFTQDRTAWIDYGQWMTRDAGDSWTHVGSTQVLDLAAREWCEEDRCGVLLLGGGAGRDDRAGVYKSFDLGRTWQCADAPTPAWWPDIPPLTPTWLPVIHK